MRTTLTLEPDVADRLRQEMRRSGRGMKAVVNEALRLGLGLSSKAVKPPAFEVEATDLGLRPGLDPHRMNQLVDELEVEAAQNKLSS